MQDLIKFVSRVTDFDTLSASEKIEYFAFYLLDVKGAVFFNAKDISTCFDELNIKPYSNIPSFLSTKSSGKNHVFLKKSSGYVIERKSIDRIRNKLGIAKVGEPSNDLFPISLFENTRGYLIKIASQAILSYDYSLFDACFVMSRKLLETLIIELFEKRKIEAKIKNAQGQYFFLSDLLGVFLTESSWTLSRNTQQGIGPIKKIADVSAHNRRFCATKPDVDKIKMDLRIVIEELIHLIDYPNWN